MEERKDELLHNSFSNTLEQKEERQKKILTQIIKLILIFLSPFLELLIRFIFFPKKNKNLCEIGEEDKCLSCINDECNSCNYRYELVNGKCQAMFSFRAVYETKHKSEYVNLLNDMYIEYISDIIIDKKRVNICKFIIFLCQEIILYM